MECCLVDVMHYLVRLPHRAALTPKAGEIVSAHKQLAKSVWLIVRYQIAIITVTSSTTSLLVLVVGDMESTNTNVDERRGIGFLCEADTDTAYFSPIFSHESRLQLLRHVSPVPVITKITFWKRCRAIWLLLASF